VCGASHFYVQELSDKLKKKSLKDKASKKRLNEYEREYAVSIYELIRHLDQKHQRNII
jgi:hypothetical protein